LFAGICVRDILNQKKRHEGVVCYRQCYKLAEKVRLFKRDECQSASKIDEKYSKKKITEKFDYMIYLEATVKCMPVLKLKIVYLKALDIAGIDQYSLIKNT
jgi:hypothetical protein